jgi:hypothetical protein
MQEDGSDREAAANEGAEEPSALFQEYVRAAEEGEEPELVPFLARAGARAGELERRIALLRALRELGELARTDGAEVLETPGALGRFRVLGLLGSGGLSRVLLAEDPELGRRVALKVLSEARFLSREARAWITNEGQVLARLRHPGVVRVLELGEAEGLPFLVMELVEGPSLGQALAALRDLRAGAGLARHSERALEAALALEPIGARVELGLALARALAACHQAGVLHRDLKPSNVLLEDRDEPRLIDFGLGNLATREESLTDVTQSLVGTPAHLSPEQVEAGRTLASAASDQFALGTLLYELLTLESPFARETRSATLAAIAAAAPRPPRKIEPRIPTDLERIVLQALGREPRDRYPSVAALADDLQAFREDRAIRARRPGPARRLRLWAKRHRRELRIALVAALLLALLGPARALWDQLRERAALEARIEAQETRIDLSREPEELARALDDLERLEEDARALAGRTWSFLTAGTVRRVAGLRAALCPRMARCFDTLSEGIASREPSTRAAARARLAERWQPILARSRPPCPEEDALVRLWSSGTVELASAPGSRPELLRHHAAVGELLSLLVPVDPAQRPEPALYRARWVGPDGGLEAEYDVLVEAGAPALRLEPRRPPPAWRSRLVRLDGGSIRFAREAPEIPVAALCVSRSPVCTEELRTARPCAPGPCTHEPAQPSLAAAVEYAAAQGLRLPSAQEWALSIRDPRVARHALLKGELVAGGETGYGRVFMLYPDEDAAQAALRNALFTDPHAIRMQYGFRLACAPEVID